MPLFAPFPGFATDAQTRAQTENLRALTPANLANRAMFRATLGGVSQSGIAPLTWTKVLWSTASTINVGAYFDTANNRWVPPASKVRLSANVAFSTGISAGGYGIVKLYKNGAELAQGSPYANQLVNEGAASATTIDLANGTDYYEVYVYGSSGATFAVAGNGALSNFCGEQI